MPAPGIQTLTRQLDDCMLKHRQGFHRRLQKIRTNRRKGKPVDAALEQLAAEMRQSARTVEQRRQNRPVLDYPESLPVSRKRKQIRETIAKHPVTVLCGETGSGKTTQLPKICMELGLGTRGLIGHTQPRRLAARSVCSRIAEELGTPVGDAVGFKVRFTDTVGDRAYIKLMTDGILLAECHHDPWLNRYDTLIIDEAHERSLNIDFLLGYLKRLTAKRSDLKIIITSATIDPERFSRHFNDAPIIEVSGRTFPVEVRYRPLHEDDDNEGRDMQEGIIDAVDELSRESRGDILVFLSGERDIRDTARALEKQKLANTETLPLLARLSAAEQNRIFHGSNARRIILATNVAETSLTVPGIKYVIDTGLARISRYSWRSKIQRLPIEKIAKSSADQRKGRCGRMSNGICIRLYSEEDFNARAEFTEPEIRRTSLAAVILQMEFLQLGHIDDFPFVEPPEERLIRDGYRLLVELGALDARHRVTPTGMKLARLPMDPRLGRMLLEGKQEGVLHEVLIIVSALAVQDPRDRPLDRQQAADEAHRPMLDARSDFLFYLNLWQRFHAQKEQLSGNRLRKWCREHYISWMRMREWIDTHRQIRTMLRDLELRDGRPVNTSEIDYAAVHRSLLTGLLGNLGLKQEEKEYLGARNRKFLVFPGSGLFNKPPKWILSAEIVETTRVYARINAKIEPQWVEEKAQHLLKHSYRDPHWEKRSAKVMATMQSTLYGLLIHPGRKVDYSRIDPVLSRDIFIRSALVERDFDCNAGFFRNNSRLIGEVESLEARSRRQDIIVDDEVLYAFYDERIPPDVCSGPTLNRWLKTLDEGRRRALQLSKEDLMQHDAAHITGNRFPDHLTLNGARYPLEYHFDPGHRRDGITLVTPAAALNAISPQRCEWLVPGMLHEKMVGLIRSLPKPIRRNFVPAPNFADACMEALEPSDRPLCSAMAEHLRKMTGIEIPYDAWRPEQLDSHLFMNYRVIDAQGETLEESRDLPVLRERFAGTVPEPEQERPSHEIEQERVGPEALDDLPDEIDVELHGVRIKGYPALAREGRNVAVRVFDSRQEADAAHADGLRRLFINAIPEPIKTLNNRIPDMQQLCLLYTGIGTCEELKSDIIDTVIEQLFCSAEITSRDDFDSALERSRSELIDTAAQLSKRLKTILSERRAIEKQLKQLPLNLLDTGADIQEQLHHLFPKRFLLKIEMQWLEQYPRYLGAIAKRLEKAQDNPNRDRQLRLHIAELWDAYRKRHDELNRRHGESEQLLHYRWMLEEYRVSLFAQELKTLFPVSEKRLKKYWNEISDA